MKNPVDNMLASRIKQVFDEFEDPGANAGWEQLRKKYPERNRRPLLLWLSSAAAVLVLVTGLLFINKQETPPAIKPVKEQKVLEQGDKSIHKDKLDSSGSPHTVKKSVFDQGIAAASTPTIADDASSETAETLIAALPLLPEDEGSLIEPLAEQFPEKDRISALADEIPLANTTKLAIKNSQVFEKIRIEQAEKPTYVKQFNPKPVEIEKKSEAVNAKGKKLALSVFAGSHFNFAEGSENQLNFGAGFTSDVRLSRNLKLSTGISIASNSLNYDSGQDVPESAASSFNSVAPSTGQSSSRDLTTITRYSASLLALDIPVNIKYQFAPESDKIYVLAGLSSGTYLNETYGYQYRNFSTASGIYSSQAKAQEIKKQLNDFDFARTLNLSFGISTPFGKTQTISIEPFIKYPLGGLGSEDLKFGSTGINLKVRFNPSKK